MSDEKSKTVPDHDATGTKIGTIYSIEFNGKKLTQIEIDEALDRGRVGYFSRFAPLQSRVPPPNKEIP